MKGFYTTRRGIRRIKMGILHHWEDFEEDRYEDHSLFYHAEEFEDDEYADHSLFYHKDDFKENEEV